MRVWQLIQQALGGVLRGLVMAGLVLAAAGCGLSKDSEPELSGPSETGISAQLKALPDVVNADGVSQSVIELVLRDQNGNPAPGRAVEFLCDGDGNLLPSADSTYVGPLQGVNHIVMATDDNGVARVVYVAGFHVGRTVRVEVRPYSFASSRINQTVPIVFSSVLIDQV